MTLRRYRAIAVGCFCLPVLLVGAERRIAEAHLNRLSSFPAFENDDLLDGDEIRIRLTLVVADGLPPVLATERLTWQPAPLRDTDVPPPAPVFWSTSRAPPSTPLVG